MEFDILLSNDSIYWDRCELGRDGRGIMEIYKYTRVKTDRLLAVMVVLAVQTYKKN